MFNDCHYWTRAGRADLTQREVYWRYYFHSKTRPCTDLYLYNLFGILYLVKSLESTTVHNLDPLRKTGLVMHSTESSICSDLNQCREIIIALPC